MTQSRPMLQKFLMSDLPKAEELLPLLRRIDQNRWYSNFGPLATEFEQKMTGLFIASDPHAALGAIHLTTMSTCYHALEAGLRIMNVPAGGKVLVPAVTFPACPFAVQFMGAEPILADIDPGNWILTPEIARKIAEKTKISAVMPVAIYGVPMPVEGWDNFARDTGIPVIIDAAAAIECQPIPQKAIVAHSMHATKPFGVGEGGLLVSRDPRHISQARIYSNFGTIDRIATYLGSNVKMSEYHAAVGLAQFERWNEVKKKRKEILALYKKHLAPLAGDLSFQPDIEKAVVSCLMLWLNKPIAAKAIAHGLSKNVTLHKMYLPPLYRHPQFTNLSVATTAGVIANGSASVETKAAHMANSEDMYRHIVGVPFHPFLDEDDIRCVASVLQEILTG